MDDPNRDEQTLRLAQLLTEEPLACERCLDDLGDYVTTQLAGRDYAALFPHVARHLDQCVACAEAYALIYEFQVAPEVNIGSVPVPDLSFLEQTSGPLRPAELRRRRAAAAFREALAAGLSHAGERLRLALSQALLDAGAVLAAAAPAPAYRDRAARPLLDLDLAAPTAAIARLQLQALPGSQPERCELQVQLELPERDWPDLAGVPILLRAGSAEYRAVTDEWGTVAFADLAQELLPMLEIEIDLQ
jgi:hypothetical protein